ncbi:HK97 family phage prohead protease [Peribacillus muralis]|uniref:HK97 family phage prohead protease n=1 Tax=Peribacillus muralis TaxID=264697 RepID=UPI0037F5CFE9
MAKLKAMRTFDITQITTRDATEDTPSVIIGYAAVFNSPTIIGDWFTEIIDPGAFSRSLSENGDIRALFNHNWDNVLGRTKSGTLKLEEDERGLKFEIELPNTTIARDLAESMSRGDINQCSFGFWVTEETWDYSVEPYVRTVNEVELFEISVVSIPAYDGTEASLVRSKEEDNSLEQRMSIIKTINNTLEGKLNE